MKSSTVMMGLSALTMVWPGMVDAKRLREPAVDKVSSASTAQPDADFAKLDLNQLPPPGLGTESNVGAQNASGSASSSGMSTQLSWPRGDRIASPELRSSTLPATQASVSADWRDVRPIGQGPRFDLVVNNAPASQVFLQMGAGAGVNVMVPPEVKGNVSLNLRAVTLTEAMEAFRELFGYDFKVSGNRVYVYPNTIQTRIYQVNYLAGKREGQSVLKVNSPGRGGQNAGGSSGSSGASSGSGTSAPASASTGSTGTIGASSGGSAGTGSFGEATRVQTSISADFWGDMASSLKDIVGTDKDHSVSVNPASGVLVVRASPAEHRQVNEYLKAIRLTVERQVMLEAKIVEVTLSTDTQNGVNWSLFRSYSSGNKQLGLNVMAPGSTLTNSGVNIRSTNVNAQPSTGALVSTDITLNPGGVLNTLKTGVGFYGLALQAGNFSALLNFLQSQGDVQVLSSPRIATLNNQKAVLKVGQDAYYPINLPTPNFSTTTTGTQINVTPPQVDTIFSGIVLDVTPRIDANGAILLHVHPIISSITTDTLTYTYNNIVGTGDLPKIAVNETDSIVRVQDRQIVAIGGLMRTQQIKSKSGFSGLSELPIIGALFRQSQFQTVKQELVVLIKPTVISEDGEGFDREEPKTTAAE